MGRGSHPRRRAAVEGHQLALSKPATVITATNRRRPGQKCLGGECS
jgi:hypothetical protein